MRAFISNSMYIEHSTRTRTKEKKGKKRKVNKKETGEKLPI